MSYVYFCIKEPFTNRVKIGYTKNPDQRMTSLKTANDDKLKIHYMINTTNGRALEKTIHKDLKRAKKHHKREWFNLTLKEIDDIIEKYKTYDIDHTSDISDVEDDEPIKNKESDDEIIMNESDSETETETEIDEIEDIIEYEDEEPDQEKEEVNDDNIEVYEEIKKINTKCKCEICNCIFPSFIKLLQHLNKSIPCSQTKCNTCGKSFSCNRALIGHIENRRTSCDPKIIEELRIKNKEQCIKNKEERIKKEKEERIKKKEEKRIKKEEENIKKREGDIKKIEYYSVKKIIENDMQKELIVKQIHKCETCKKEFKGIKTLNNHIQKCKTIKDDELIKMELYLKFARDIIDHRNGDTSVTERIKNNLRIYMNDKIMINIIGKETLDSLKLTYLGIR
jgi:hypothetical protein